MGKLLNIGCGRTYHPAWVNIDLQSSSPEVEQHDIRSGLPYPDACFEACYSSHLIEHLTPVQAQGLLGEIWRVLKPQGTVRVAVPDLERLAQSYLSILEQAEEGTAGAEDDYDWIMLELYDQVIRSFPGGNMGEYLRRPDLKNKDFIVARLGAEAEACWMSQQTISILSTWEKIRSKTPAQLANRVRIELAKFIVRLVAGREKLSAFEEGLFRNSGEIHRWMYDRFSLQRLLRQAGFVDVKVCAAAESRIPNFHDYKLDVRDGKVRKPDSLFMEGVKP